MNFVGFVMWLLWSCIVATSGQFIYEQPAMRYHHQIVPAVGGQGSPFGQPRPNPHPSVVANAAKEAQLPAELLKSNRFYDNPRIAAALAKESWLTDKEMAVVNREAEKIPREMVLKLFKNAGWIRRR